MFYCVLDEGDLNFPSLGPRRPGEPEHNGPQAEFSFSNSLTDLSAASQLTVNLLFDAGSRPVFQRENLAFQFAHFAHEVRQLGKSGD